MSTESALKDLKTVLETIAINTGKIGTANLNLEKVVDNTGSKLHNKLEAIVQV